MGCTSGVLGRFGFDMALEVDDIQQDENGRSKSFCFFFHLECISLTYFCKSEYIGGSKVCTPRRKQKTEGFVRIYIYIYTLSHVAKSLFAEPTADQLV